MLQYDSGILADRVMVKAQLRHAEESIDAANEKVMSMKAKGHDEEEILELVHERDVLVEFANDIRKRLEMEPAKTARRKK